MTLFFWQFVIPEYMCYSAYLETCSHVSSMQNNVIICQYHSCWWFDNITSQGIDNRGIDFPDYSEILISVQAASL